MNFFFFIFRINITVEKRPVAEKLSKVMMKRRKTMSYDHREQSNDEDGSTREQNTNQEMFAKNSLYRTQCIYCNTNCLHLVQHYQKCHPDCEVPISRMSKWMVQHLKAGNEIFERNDKKKITGLCYFCQEKRSFSKNGWQSHLITHTGEQMFNCTDCHAQFKARNEHDSKACKTSVVNVFETKAKGALVGYMCNDCNYFQFSRGRLVSHLRNEHGFQAQEEPHHYKQFQLVQGFFETNENE